MDDSETMSESDSYQSDIFKLDKAWHQ